MSSSDYSRQSFLGEKSTEILSSARVALVGASGGGSHVAQQLAHLGVKHFRIIDPKKMEAKHLNRVVTATADDVEGRTAKAEILRRTILGVRPEAQVEVEVGEWQTVPHLIADVHVVFGCIDGFRQREYLERAARRYLLPYIDVGMDVVDIGGRQFAVGGQVIVTRPYCPCMRCLGFLTSDRLNKEEDNYGHAGGVPQVVWTNGILASLAVGEFVKLLTPWFRSQKEYEWLELDGNAQTVQRSLQPEYFVRDSCPHFDGPEDLGDPSFSLRSARR